MGGMTTLGTATKPPPVWPRVMFTFEYGSPLPRPIVMGGITMVMVVVVVKKVVMTWPPAAVEEPLRPYSRDVVYMDGEMVLGSDRALVGNTSTHGGE